MWNSSVLNEWKDLGLHQAGDVACSFGNRWNAMSVMGGKLLEKRVNSFCGLPGLYELK